MSCSDWSGRLCASDAGVTAGVSFGLVTVGVLDISMIDREAAAVLRLERHLVGGGWVAFLFFCFGMTTGVNLLQLTQSTWQHT